jgi:hypothetical protein
MRRALEVAPGDPQVLDAAIGLFEQQKLTSESDAALTALEGAEPTSRRLVIAKVNRELARGDLSIAEALLEPLLTADPPTVDARYLHACILSRKRQIERSADVLSEVLQDDPDRLEWATHDPDLANLRHNARAWRRAIRSAD